MKVRKDYDIDIGLWYLNHANSYHIVQNPSRVIPPENIFVGSGSIDDLIGEGHEWYDDIVFLMDSSETINKVRYTKECVALEEEIYRIINALRDDPLATSEEPDAIQKFMKTPDFSTLFKYYATMYKMVHANIEAYQKSLLQVIEEREQERGIEALATSVKLCASIFAGLIRRISTVLQDEEAGPQRMNAGESVRKMTKQQKEKYYPRLMQELDMCKLKVIRHQFLNVNTFPFCGVQIYLDFLKNHNKNIYNDVKHWISDVLHPVSWPTYHKSHTLKWDRTHKKTDKEKPLVNLPEAQLTKSEAREDIYSTSYMSQPLRTLYSTLDGGGNFERTTERMQKVNRKNKVITYDDEQEIGIAFETYNEDGTRKNSCIVTLPKDMADRHDVRRRLPRASRLMKFLMMLARKNIFVDGDIVKGAERLDVPYQTFLDWNFLRDRAHIKRDLLKFVPILAGMKIWIASYRYTRKKGDGGKTLVQMEAGRTGLSYRPFFTGIDIDSREGYFTVYFNSQADIPWKSITAYSIITPNYIHNTEMSDRAAGILNAALENLRSRLTKDTKLANQIRHTHKAYVKISSTMAASTFPSIKDTKGHLKGEIVTPYKDAVAEANRFDNDTCVRLSTSDADKRYGDSYQAWIEEGELEVELLGPFYDAFMEPTKKRIDHIKDAKRKQEKKEIAIAAAAAKKSSKKTART